MTLRASQSVEFMRLRINNSSVKFVESVVRCRISVICGIKNPLRKSAVSAGEKTQFMVYRNEKGEPQKTRLIISISTRLFRFLHIVHADLDSLHVQRNKFVSAFWQ